MNDGLTKHQRYRLSDLDGYRKMKREYARTPEERRKRIEYNRIWRSKNRERYNALAREYHSKHKDEYADHALRKAYGIGLPEYNRMLAEQDGKCWLCGAPPNGKRLHVDHNHTTLSVRKLLCSSCNLAIAVAEKVGIDKIEQYLK